MTFLLSWLLTCDVEDFALAARHDCISFVGAHLPVLARRKFYMEQLRLERLEAEATAAQTV